DAAIERVIKQGCDGVVVYGGAETVRSYREDLGLHTKLIEYGPKYSFVMVTADALARTGLDAAARRIAHDVVMWEQRACSSPPGGGTEWTVVVQRTPEFQTSCLNRTVFVKPVPRLEEAITAMEPLAGYLQSVAILADLPRAEALGQALTRLGADRFVEIGQMA